MGRFDFFLLAVSNARVGRRRRMKRILLCCLLSSICVMRLHMYLKRILLCCCLLNSINMIMYLHCLLPLLPAVCRADIGCRYRATDQYIPHGRNADMVRYAARIPKFLWRRLQNPPDRPPDSRPDRWGNDARGL